MKMPRGGKRPGAGRPRRNPKGVADVTLSMRFTSGEFSSLEKAAGQESVSDWGRKTLLDAAKK